MEYIVIDGKKYKLIPVEEETDNVISDYLSQSRKNVPKVQNAIQDKETTIEDAVPKVSDYRERFKKHQLRLSDLKVEPNYRVVEKPKEYGELDKFSYKGEKLFFGPGTEQEI